MYNVKKSWVKKASHRFRWLLGVSERLKLKSRQCQDKGSFHISTPRYLLFCFLKDEFYAKKILTYTYIPIKNILAIKLQAKEIIQNCYQMSLPNKE